MLFHITYEFSPQERDGAQKRFKETGVPPPDGVTMQGRGLSPLLGTKCPSPVDNSRNYF